MDMMKARFDVLRNPTLNGQLFNFLELLNEHLLHRIDITPYFIKFSSCHGNFPFKNLQLRFVRHL